MNKRPTNVPSAIYGLADPVSGELRYVGWTTKPLAYRLRRHLELRSGQYLNRWMSALKSKGMRPDIFEIEHITGDHDWREAERFWIAYFRSIGCRLANATEDGEGAVGRALSQESRSSISARLRGRTQSAETRHKRANSLASLPPEKKAELVALRQAGLGEAARAQQGAAMRLYYTNEDNRKKTSEATAKAVRNKPGECVRRGLFLQGLLIGRDAPWAKLTAEDVRKIRNDLRPAAVIAEQYGVSRRNISHIKTGRTWAHISPEAQDEDEPSVFD